MEDKKKKNFIINLLRAGTFKWKPRGEAKKRYKVEVGKFKTGNPKYGYYCQSCEEVFKSKDVKMDHIEAIVNPVTGFIGFDTYVERMFCTEDLFCCLCSDCHDEKTATEREYRNKFNALRKEGKKDTKLEKKYHKFLKNYLDKKK